MHMHSYTYRLEYMNEKHKCKRRITTVSITQKYSYLCIYLCAYKNVFLIELMDIRGSI